MSADPFDLVDAKREEASHCLRKLGQVYVRPEHQGQATPNMIAAMSCPGTIVAHEWHGQFRTLLHGFLATTRSIPDIIECRFGYDDKAPADRKKWFKSLDPGEQQRRKDFSKAFKPDFDAFKGHALSAQRRKAIHFDGQADWHVDVKGFRGRIYFGDNTTPLDQVEAQEFSGDPASDVPAMSSPALHLQPRSEDFWLGSIGRAIASNLP